MSVIKRTNRFTVVKKGFVNSVYAVVCLCLLLYSIFSGLYLNIPAGDFLNLERAQYSTNHLTVTPVTCGFPVSGQYGRAPQITCYVLLSATVLLRNYRRLAAGAAASAMTYSGVSAIHLLLLFSQGNRFIYSTADSRCLFLEIPGVKKSLPICNGVYDPDYFYAVDVLSASLLAALPMAMWSKTFKRAADKPILTMWILLLAISHSFYNIIVSDPGPHFQVCPPDAVERLPQNQYQAVAFDSRWQNSFDDMMFPMRNNHTLSSYCIYSCFSPSNHLGRKDQEIGVYDVFFRDQIFDPSNRKLGVSFWLIYIAAAASTLFTGAKQRVLPAAAYKILFVWRPFWDSNDAIPLEVNGVVLIRFLTQISSVLAFVAYLFYSQYQLGAAPYSESFGAVGQWSGVAVVLLILAATAVGKISSMFCWEEEEELMEPEDEEWVKNPS